MTGTTVILRSIQYKFRRRNESKVFICDSNIFSFEGIEHN